MKIKSIAALALCAVAALCSSAIAQAAGSQVVLSWVAPTANTDGSKVTLAGGYNIFCDSTAAALAADEAAAKFCTDPATGKALSGSVLNSFAMTSYTFANVAPGTYFYGVQAWDCDGSGNCGHSAFSSTASATISPPTVNPGPPTGVKVTVTVTAPSS